MTDERQPEGGQAPEPELTPDEPAAPEQAESPAAMDAAMSPPAATPPPPPLAPYVSPAPATPPAQPAVAWAAPAPAGAVGAVEGKRTSLAAAAGVILIVLGVLGGLLALLVLALAGMAASFASGGAFDEVPGMPAGFGAIIGGVIAIVAVVMLVYVGLAIAGGIGVLRSRGWGRVIGIVVGVIGTLFWLLAVFSPSSSSEGRTGGVIFAFVLLALHLYITIVLIGYWRNAPAVQA